MGLESWEVGYTDVRLKLGEVNINEEDCDTLFHAMAHEYFTLISDDLWRVPEDRVAIVRTISYESFEKVFGPKSCQSQVTVYREPVCPICGGTNKPHFHYVHGMTAHDCTCPCCGKTGIAEHYLYHSSSADGIRCLECGDIWYVTPHGDVVTDRRKDKTRPACDGCDMFDGFVEKAKDEDVQDFADTRGVVVAALQTILESPETLAKVWTAVEIAPGAPSLARELPQIVRDEIADAVLRIRGKLVPAG